MKPLLYFAIICAGIASSQAELTQIHNFEVRTKPPQKFGSFVDVTKYEKYFSSDPYIANLTLTPKKASEYLKKACQTKFGRKTLITPLFTTISYYEVAPNRYLWFYSFQIWAQLKNGDAIQRTLLVMPNGDVVFPAKLK